MTADERRTARLVVGRDGAELGQVSAQAIRRAAGPRKVPPRPVCIAQAMALKAGALSLERHVVAPMAAARRRTADEAIAAEPARLLVRVDEFPHAGVWDSPKRYGNDAFRRFHSILREAGVPYLLAVTSRPCHAYLNPSARGDRPLTDDEQELLRSVCAEGVEPAAHGLTHRTRHRRPRRRSELCGLDERALVGLLERSDQELADAGLRPSVFVAPFNRFDADQLPVLARRYAVVCAGPESVPLLGFLPGPAWRCETVYFPSYPPLYDRASPMADRLHAVISGAAGTWLQLTLHFGWEADDGYGGLTRLAEAVAPFVRPWSEFLTAVDDSRAV